MKLLLFLVLFANICYSSQADSSNQGLIQPFIPNPSAESYQNVNLYSSINNDSLASLNVSIQSQSIFQYPEDFDPVYYIQNKQKPRSKKEICCCICTGISSSTILAFIGYLIFH